MKFSPLCLTTMEQPGKSLIIAPEPIDPCWRGHETNYLKNSPPAIKVCTGLQMCLYGQFDSVLPVQVHDQPELLNQGLDDQQDPGSMKSPTQMVQTNNAIK